PPAWLHEPVNWKDDFFHRPVYVSFQSDLRDSDLARLRNLPDLQFLALPSDSLTVTDTGMTDVDELKSLEVLTLGLTITDKGLRYLSDLHRLQSLNIAVCNEITGSGLAALGCQRTLKSLALGSGVLDKYLADLQKFVALERLWIGGTGRPPQVTERG